MLECSLYHYPSTAVRLLCCVRDNETIGRNYEEAFLLSAERIPGSRPITRMYLTERLQEYEFCAEDSVFLSRVTFAMGAVGRWRNRCDCRLARDHFRLFYNHFGLFDRRNINETPFVNRGPFATRFRVFHCGEDLARLGHGRV